MVTTAYPVFVPHSVHILTIGLDLPDTHKLKSYGFGEALAPVSHRSCKQAGISHVLLLLGTTCLALLGTKGQGQGLLEACPSCRCLHFWSRARMVMMKVTTPGLISCTEEKVAA